MNKNIEYYLSLNHPMTLEVKDNIFYIKFNDLAGCIADGKNLSEVYTNAKEAKKAWLETALELNLTIPIPDSDEDKASGTFVVRCSKSLHRKLKYLSKDEGVSLNQFVNYALTNYSASYEIINKLDKKIESIENKFNNIGLIQKPIFNNYFINTKDKNPPYALKIAV